MFNQQSNLELLQSINNNPYAWPGGYPLHAIMEDGATLCAMCCQDNHHNIAESLPGDGWTIAAITPNYESVIYCEHCGHVIEAAYLEESEQ